MAAPLHLIKTAATHTTILILVLVAAFLSLAFHPGSLVDIMRLGYVLFIVHLVAGTYHFKYLTRAHLVMFAVMLLILLLNFTVPLSQIHASTLSNFIAVPGLVLVCHMLACCPPGQLEPQLKLIGVGALIIAVAGQLTIFMFSSGTDGAYKNIHHLGLFASVCIPVAGYFAATCKKTSRWMATLTGVVALYLLWESGSRISWLAFFLSAVLTVLATPAKKQIVFILLFFACAAFITAGVSGFEDIVIRIEEFLGSWQSEERVYIWRDAFELMKQNDLPEWLRGRGIGSFRYFMKDYPGLSIDKLEAQPTFPHNIGIQLLFENGIIGLILVFCALGAFVRGLWRGLRRSIPGDTRHLYLVCFIVFWILFFHTFLTKSIYSKYITYLFSMVAGLTFALDQRKGHTRSLAEMFPNVFSAPRE